MLDTKAFLNREAPVRSPSCSANTSAHALHPSEYPGSPQESSGPAGLGLCLPRAGLLQKRRKVGFVPLAQSCASSCGRAEFPLNLGGPTGSCKNSGISTLSCDLPAFHCRADHPHSGSGQNPSASRICAVETLMSLVLQSCNPQGDAKVLVTISCCADHELPEIFVINM